VALFSNCNGETIVIVQACLNGARSAHFHPRLPLTSDAMVKDARACIEAGASELHIHPRDASGNESLSAIDDLMPALRNACSGTLVGVSTGAWIEGDPQTTREKIAAWRTCPDYASVNLSEPDAPAIMSLLREKSVGIEAGLATPADAERFVALPVNHHVFRILIEIDEQDEQAASRLADQIHAIVIRAGIFRPILLHGFDATAWPLVEHARDRLWSTRIGFEDTCRRLDGSPAQSNAELVTDAMRLMHYVAT
jgi:uncharacterized protein (DUF849 family)